MSISLRIQWISLIAFTCSSLLIRDRLAASVPPANYAMQSLLSRPFILFWLAWLVWYSFGPGRRRPRPQTWLFADPLIAWAAHVPMIGSLVLTWPYADEPTLILFALFDITFIIGIAMASIRPAPSRGFGSPLPLVLPAALMVFFLAHPSRYSTALILWLVVLGLAFVYARHVIERLLNQTHESNLRLAAERDARSRFLAAAAHDLALPLQAARMFFDQSRAARGIEARRRAAGNVAWALDHVGNLIAGIGEFLRLEAGATGARLAPTPLGPAIAAAAELAEPLARLGRVELRAMPSSLAALADPVLLDRALANLVGNAIRHARARRILVGARRCGAGRVRVWTIDDGRGIAEEDREHLFDDYFKGTGHDGAQSQGGFGLGLGSVRRMAELMGGAAGIDHGWRRGCAFWLELDLA